MDMASINFRMERSQKNEPEKVCREMGMTMTTAFNIFAQRVNGDTIEITQCKGHY